MKFILFCFFVFSSVATLAKGNPQLALSSILDGCASNDIDTCESRMIGDSKKKVAIASLLRAMKNNDRVRRLYIEAYGAREYEKFSETFNVSFDQLTESHFSLESSGPESAIFTGEGGDILSIRNEKGLWYLDLDKTKFSVLAGTVKGGKYDFIKLFSAAQSKVINLIETNSPVKKVYRKGGLYYLIAVHSISDPKNKQTIENLFLELGQDIFEIRNEVLAN